MYASAFVLGFHGCDEEVGEKILRGNDHLKQSGNPYDWLGHGIYFWENSPLRAMEWARYMKSRPDLFKGKVKNPFVIGAIINLGNCLDLTEAASLQITKTAHTELKKTFEFANAPMPKNEAAGKSDEDRVKRNLDCAVLNYVHELRRKQKLPAFDTVRGAFPEGKPLYPGAGIREKTHIQTCVRNGKSILGYFRPMSAQSTELEF